MSMQMLVLNMMVDMVLMLHSYLFVTIQLHLKVFGSILLVNKCILVVKVLSYLFILNMFVQISMLMMIITA